MNKKNFLTLLISTFFSIFFLYVIFFFKIYYEKLENVPYLFKSMEKLEFHEKYSKKLHHLRDTHGRWDFNDNVENYLFTTIKKFSKDGNNVLFQGDSWIEGIHLNKESLKFVSDFATSKNYGIINGGVTSFSPSLMKIQYEVLETDFNIKPNIVIAYIDQTDIGDELCRYSSNRVLDDKKNLIAVENESYTRATYDYTKINNISRIVLSESSKFKKTIRLVNFFIIYQPKRLFNKIISIKEYGWKNRDTSKCLFDQIQKYLIKSNINEVIYFESRVNEYIDYLVSKDYIERIIIVTFPHENHVYNKKYSYNVSDTVEKISLNKSKIYHLNFSKLISNKLINIEENIYTKNDPGSHLKPQHHKDIFIKNILNLLD